MARSLFAVAAVVMIAGCSSGGSAGPRGPEGPPGAPGATGPAGPQGPPGAAAIFPPDADQWRGKKIAWYGTSIPAGAHDPTIGGYPNRAARALGAVIQNRALGSSTIRRHKMDGTLMLAAYEAASFLNPSAPRNIKTDLLDLLGTVNEPDLFVFDWGVNDWHADDADFLRFDPADPYSSDPAKLPVTSRDPNTFIGATNGVIDQLLAAKPRARFVFVAHYTRGWVSKGVGQYDRLIATQEALARYWGAPISKVYEVGGFRRIADYPSNNFDLLCPDGIHPYSDSTGEGEDILTTVAYSFLRGIR